MSQSIKLFNKKIKKNGENYFLILEAGTSHYELADYLGITPYDAAIKIIDNSSLASYGYSAIKFQTFKAEKLAHKLYAKDQYNFMRRRDTLDYDAYKDLAKYCSQSLRPSFMTTIFDLEGLRELGDVLKVFKVASPDITNFALLNAINEYGKPVILSTGGATINEIREALSKLINCKVAILHCTAVYPTSTNSLNLSFIKRLNEEFPNNVIGWSSHNPDVSFAPIAYGLGARIFEYHFKMDVPIQGGDYNVSITKDGVNKMKNLIHKYNLSSGDKETEFLKQEESLRKNGRRSLFTACDIQKGDRITLNNIIALRPTIKNAYLDSEVDKMKNRVAKDFIPANTPLYYDIVGINID